MRIDMEAWALLLIALGVGYLICLKASKEGVRLFKYGGYVIGVVILGISLILAVSDLGRRISHQRAISRRTRRTSTRSTVGERTRPSEIPELPQRIIERTAPGETSPPPAE